MHARGCAVSTYAVLCVSFADILKARIELPQRQFRVVSSRLPVPIAELQRAYVLTRKFCRKCL